MSTIVTRAGKGASLTWAEGDANFTNLNNDKYQAGDSPTFNAITGTSAVLTSAAIGGAAISTLASSAITITSAVDGIPLILSDSVGSAEFDFSSGHLYFGTTSAHDLFIQVNGIAVARWDDGTGTFFTAPLATNPDLALTNGQIKFPATQVPSADANTLDDYEEGSWTPTLTFGGASTGITYTVRNGNYVKIGKMVYYTLNITLSSKGSATGAAGIGGLPYTVGSTTGMRGTSVCSYFSAFSSITSFIGLTLSEGTTNGTLITGGAANVGIMAETNFNNTSDLYLAGFYIAAA